ncbi:ankyrin repeat and SAM domain-containing protein 4B-like [Anneissia japonica]|uniref:ankyrin repeat and SAM domain-containing protein 4B-like n=1 Tax=Anneissia japonica TaxID=1529436 RepID=UPI0014259E12|nr:ankyrin repeat and SAM domain-containing protein 4B-like [Anneissia japonica]
MSDRFHIAAKNGSLDVLSEATRKDCNKPDEDGMTPTLWAAVKGNVDTLRVIVSRGGDPDKCDNLGNTSLHWAAKCGHINAITFLVSFNCNVWAMNNDHQTPMDVAAENNRKSCVDFLDDVSSKKSSANPKLVRKMKLEAMNEADKRVKKYYKWQEKMQKKIIKEENKETITETKKDKSKISTISFSGGRKKSNQSTTAEGSYGTTARIKRDSERNIDIDHIIPHESGSPNTFLMVTDQQAANAMTSLPTGGRGAGIADDILNGSNELEQPESNSVVDGNEIDPKLGTRGNRVPWDEDQLDLDDDGDDASNSLLELFLAANGLHDYLINFIKEDIDLDAVKLLIDDDLSKLGIPMGPRRKLLQAIAKRRMVMEFPNAMVDSEL